MSSFDNVDIPTSNSGSLYMSKWEQGPNRIRFLGGITEGYKWFPEDGSKPKHVKTPGDIDTGVKESKYFWMIPIAMNGDVRILTFTQITIMKQMEALKNSEEWGDPIGYDITVTKTGEKMDTNYAVMPHPAKEIEQSVKEKWQEMKNRFKPDLLFTTGTPLESAEEVKQEEDLPF